MDPATAIGVASAAIAFADFSAKLLSTTHKLYKSASNRTEREQKALNDLKDFRHLAQNVQGSLMKCSGMTGYENDVQLVLGDIDSIDQDFEDLIKGLVARKKKKGKHVFKSMGTAASSLHAESKVREMQERLNQMQDRTLRFTLLAIW